MNKRVFIFIAVIILLIGIYCTTIVDINNNRYIDFVSGQLKINDKYLEKYGYVPLNGEWIFFPDEFIGYDKAKASQGNGIKVNLPGAWTNCNGEIGARGHGTYLLALDYEGVEQSVQFLFPIAPSEAYDVYINDKLMLRVGNATDDKDSTFPEYKSATISTVLKEKIYFIIHVSNYNYHNGGFVKPIILGQSKSISALKTKLLIKDIFIIGSLTITLLFILILLFMSKINHRLMIYLALANIISLAYAVSTGEFVIHYLFPNVSFKAYFSMYYLLSISGGTILIYIVNNIYKEIRLKIVRALSTIKIIILFSLLFFASNSFVGIISSIKDVLVVLEFIYSIIVLLIAIKLKRKNTAILLIGVIILFVSVLWDIMYAYSVIFTSFEMLTAYGLVIFMLCFLVTIVQKYKDAFHQANEYADRLTQLENISQHSISKEDKIVKKQVQDNKEMLSVKVMGEFEVLTHSGETIHFRTKKTKELMAYLVHNYDKQISSDTIINDLWTDKTFDKAKSIFYTTGYYLKKSLNTDEQTIIKNKYILHKDDCFIDYVQMLDGFERLNDNNKQFDIVLFEQLIDSYQGEYFEKEDYPWAISRRTKINQLVIDICKTALLHYESTNQVDKQIFLYEMLININEYEVSNYTKLLDLYKKSNQSFKITNITARMEKIVREIN